LGEQRVVIVGAGSAGCGIGALLLRDMIDAGSSEADAKARFFAVDRDGLLVEGMPGLRPEHAPFVQPRAAVADWRLEQPGRIGLLDVVRNARPTVLIGVSGQPGAFPENVVRLMAETAERPVIFPLSNPTSRAEASPADLLAWTDGRAVIGAGSPFPPLLRNGVYRRVDQTNNSYVFPGIGLGAIAAQARRISDGMLMAAARAVAEASPARLDPDANLLPPVTELRDVSYHVALAVAAQAQAEGLADATDRDALEARVRAKMWTPVYRPYRRKS
jgi:malate dehydrogenase (oxaloacetate-decarboxylating)